MTDEVYLSPVFWLAIATVLGCGVVVSRVKILSFGFLAVALASQYVVHAVHLFGFKSNVTWYCILFWVALVSSVNPWWVGRVRSLLNRGRDATGDVWVKPFPSWSGQPALWITASKIYLITYGLVRLATYPWLGGELDIAERLAASQGNRLVFILGLGILPPIAAVATQWFRRGYRFGLLDLLTITLTMGALLASGSKATIAPAALIMVGAAYFTTRPLRSRQFFIFAGVSVLVISAVGYAIAVAARSANQAIDAILLRLAASTDSLDYLAALAKSPSDYPFAGIGALIPTIAKRLGYAYDYSPGVWLQGERYGQWQGFGPNPGIVMDYFANLSWFALIIPIAIGTYCAFWTHVGGPVGASFASVTYLALVDVTLFQAAVGVWLVVLIVVFLIVRLRRKASAARDDATDRAASRRWLYGGIVEEH